MRDGDPQSSILLHERHQNRADQRFRQDRARRIRTRTRDFRRRDAVHRRHRQAAQGVRYRGNRGVRPYGLSGDARRPRQDAAPKSPRRHSGAARSAGAPQRTRSRRYRADRPYRGQSLSIQPDRGATRRQARGSDRGHRHRRPCDGEERRQELRACRGHHGSCRLRGNTQGNAGGERRDRRANALQARAKSVLAYRSVRWRDQQLPDLVIRERRARRISAATESPFRASADVALWREPAPECGVLPRSGSRAGKSRALHAVAGQGAFVQQHR